MARKERVRKQERLRARHDMIKRILLFMEVEFTSSASEKIYAMTQTLFLHDPRIFYHFLSGTSFDLNPIIHLG